MCSIRKYVASVLIGCMLMSCSASKHFGVVTVAKPAMTELNADRWFKYYQDQLDAYNGKIEKPNDAYPPQAQKGYEGALSDWENKKKDFHQKQTIIGIIILAGLMVYLVTESTKGIGNIGGFDWR